HREHAERQREPGERPAPGARPAIREQREKSQRPHREGREVEPLARDQTEESGTAEVEAQHLAHAEAEPGTPAARQLGEARGGAAPVTRGEAALDPQRNPRATEAQAELEVLLRVEPGIVAADVDQRAAAVERGRGEEARGSAAIADLVEVGVAAPLDSLVDDPLLDPAADPAEAWLARRGGERRRHPRREQLDVRVAEP